MAKKLSTFLICIQFFISSVSWSQSTSSFLRDLDKERPQGVSDYMIKRYPNQKLIPVKLIGGVYKPGFYRVPDDTTLLSLISYSGGATASADVEKVKIWQPDGSGTKVVNINEILGDSKAKDPLVKENDVILISEKTPLFSQDTAVSVAVVSTVVATILSLVLVVDKLDK